MRPYALVLGVGLLGYLAYRHLTGRRAPVLIGMLVVLLAVGGFTEYRWRAGEHRYTTATQELLHRADTHVECESMSHAMVNVWNRAGWVAWTPDGSRPRRADLVWGTCRALGKWERSGKTATDLDQVIAVHVLTHEAMHLAGHYGEAEAECFAMQNDSAMAQLLGATRTNADALAVSYWTNVYPRMRSDYVTGDCVASGPLDQTPGDGVWP